jgi:hypothetical protein
VDFSDYPNDVKQFQLSGRKLLQKHQEVHSVSFGFSGAPEISIFISFTPPIPEKSGRKPKTYARPSDFPEAFRKLPIVGENRLAGVPTGVQTTEPLALGGRHLRQDPVRPGLDIAAVPANGELHPRRGTLGCMALCAIRWMSSGHVISGATSLVLQPSSQLMPPTMRTLCGRVTRTCVDLDCAVASVIDRTTNPKMLGLGVAPRNAKLPELDDPVVKFGAGNNRSYGIVKRLGIVRMNLGGDFADILIPCCQISRIRRLTRSTMSTK